MPLSRRPQFTRFRSSVGRGSLNTPTHSFQPNPFFCVFSKLLIFCWLENVHHLACRLHAIYPRTNCRHNAKARVAYLMHKKGAHSDGSQKILPQAHSANIVSKRRVFPLSALCLLRLSPLPSRLATVALPRSSRSR